MPRFVVLTHDHPFFHWDFLVEEGDALRSWRLLEPPAPNRPIAAQPLPPHRRQYLDYEGPVSGNRGTVARWDAGEYELLSNEPTRVALRLRGTRVRGLMTLTADRDPAAGSADENGAETDVADRAESGWTAYLVADEPAAAE